MPTVTIEIEGEILKTLKELGDIFTTVPYCV